MNTLYGILGVRTVKKDLVFTQDVSHKYEELHFQSIYSNKDNTQIKFNRVLLLQISPSVYTLVSNGVFLLEDAISISLETEDRTTIPETEYSLSTGSVYFHLRPKYDLIYANFIIENEEHEEVVEEQPKPKPIRRPRNIVSRSLPIINNAIPILRHQGHSTISNTLTVGNSIVGDKTFNVSGTFNLNNILSSNSIELVDISSSLLVKQNMTVNGNLTVVGQIINEVNSDFRLKTHIEPVRSALDKIMNINGITFLWTDTSRNLKPIYTGFIAQNVRDYIPEVVYGDETKEMLTMSYIGLIPYLVESIKELKRENDILKGKIDVLTEKINT